MKHFSRFFLFLALAAGMIAGCDPDIVLVGSHEDLLTVSPSQQKISADGTASFTFTFKLLKPSKNNFKELVDLKETETIATIHFEATGGTVNPASATTDENGNVTVTFTASDLENFTGGTVKGIVKRVKGKVADQQGNLATATATVLPLNAEEPASEGIKKAEALKENTYSIQKGSGAVQVFPLPPEYSNWYVGTSYMDATKQSVHVELMDEEITEVDGKPKYNTMGWFNGEIPPEVANKLTTISQEFYNKYPWASAKFGTFRLGQDKTLDAHMGKGGNVKPDGSSQFWLKEKKGTKAYSGEYQLLFVFVFANQVYNPETDSYVSDGDEYTICCNATVSELVAELSNFSLNYTDNWVVPGKSTTLTAMWTAGASFDWSKVKLDSQTCNGSSGEWFSWDSSTQQLYAKNSANNQQVKLTFSYTGTDLTSSISLYNGPGYSSFSLSVKDSSLSYALVENEPAYGWGSDTIWLTADEWTPQDNSSFNGYGIEIDPATENYNKLYYNPYGMYVDFKKGIPEGDFDLIFRSVTDHSAKCTVPVKVVHHKVISFQITYKHSNGVFEPWTSGGENGTCNYPNGMELGVITNPEDAYWDWSHVELVGNEDNFNFYGHGGKDEHAKLVPKTSHDSPVLGSQVIFRLKWDGRKKSEIYVDQN